MLGYIWLLLLLAVEWPLKAAMVCCVDIHTCVTSGVHEPPKDFSGSCAPGHSYVQCLIKEIKNSNKTIISNEPLGQLLVMIFFLLNIRDLG